MFGNYDFGLDEAQEERARRLHRDSIIIDTLFQGPCGYRSYTDAMINELDEIQATKGDEEALSEAWRMPIRKAIAGEFEDFYTCWHESGITGANRQVGGTTAEHILTINALNQAQFDHLPWLSKATKAEHFREAKRNDTHVGFVSTQDTIQFGKDLDSLNVAWDLGMRMIQLTYNSVNFVGGGCTDRVDCGVTNFGKDFIGRMNELGIIVDTGHCGRQTTLDACELSSKTVVASHTAAAGIRLHDRAKSDDELRAIADTGGYIGIVAVGPFLSEEPVATVEHLLDHIDYVAQLVGPQHVGIGSDWPMQMHPAGAAILGRYAAQIGFRPEHGVTEVRNLVGFDDYRDFPNITRGLVKRGYSDEEISGILGGNFLRVFEDVCG